LDSRFIVLYAGAHGLSNDLGTLLEAARLLLDRSDIALVLLGDGKDKPALVQRAQEQNLTNISFIPPLPKAQMPFAMAAADACIAILKPIPLFTTVYPNKVFDYMAAGKPVLLAINGVIREVVESIQAGIFVEPGDASGIARAIKQLADQPESGRAMGLRGRQYVEKHFDRAVLAGQLEQVLMETIQKP
jgi:glycosyltransferase involved in cell wall biosynthesis